ncbi:MAG: GAF domain-containing protein [Candidatus Promineifilaceae bacterium]|nr:GAF domain-containing protein [Candidatus Promineifilaceae bacterium]
MGQRVGLAFGILALLFVGSGVLSIFCSGSLSVAGGESAQALVWAWQALSFLGVLLAILFGWLVVRSVVQPVQGLTAEVEQMASGADLAKRLRVARHDEVGRLAAAYNIMADRVQRSYQELEARTRALLTSIQVGRSLSTILDRATLTDEVVHQVQQAFGYYHVHIYLVEPSGRELEMVGGTGAAGRQMLAQGHSLFMGQGIVGRTAREGEPVLVPDVSTEPAWLPNPLLPETRAEVAVPITYAGGVLGVLDVQHDIVGGLDETDAELLQAIAGQVGIALQNARLVEEAGRRAEMATMVNAIGQRIQRATTVEEVLQVAARELGQALTVESARVQLDRRAAYRSGGEAG